MVLIFDGLSHCLQTFIIVKANRGFSCVYSRV